MEPSIPIHVLQSRGFDRPTPRAGFSLGVDPTEEEIDVALDELRTALERMQYSILTDCSYKQRDSTYPMQGSSSQREWLQIQFDDLTVWKRGEQRAPHKPLLVLYALGRLAQGDRWLQFSEIEGDLKHLLIEFGPPRQSHHPEYPFWHLQSDDVWVVPEAEKLEMRESASNPPKTELREKEARGGFSEDVYKAFRARSELRREIADLLLSSHFPSSLHQDIATAVGLNLEGTESTDRDPKFRKQVLQAYQYRCAICGFDLQIGIKGGPIGLEAAHIKWKQARGPDDVSNGLALCALHHKMLDKGALHVTKEMRLVVSEAVHGSDPHFSRLRNRHGEQIHTPQRTTYYPDGDVVTWHVNEVFRGVPET